MTKQSKKNKDFSSDEILKKLDSFENRLSKIEKAIALKDVSRLSGVEKQTDTGIKEEEAELPYTTFSKINIENVLGEHALGWIGNIVLLFGLTFLTQYLQNKGFNLLSGITGYVSVLSIFIVSHFIRHSFTNMSNMFKVLGHILLYYFTFRLHFISDNPLLSSKGISIILLLLINAFQFYWSVRHQSAKLAGLAFILTLITSVLSDTTHVMLPVLLASAGFSVYTFYRFEWKFLLVFSELTTYLLFLFWLIGNPFMGHTVGILESHENGQVYLFVLAVIYSMVLFISQRDSITNDFINWTIVLNGFGFSLLLLFIVLGYFQNNFISIFLSIFVLCFLFSGLLKVKSVWKSAHALYALYSFVALSVAVYGLYDLPNSFFLLSIESVLVIAIALWFRSKLIVILNTILYIVLLMVYLMSSGSVDHINFSFAFVALISARILNWKRDRLEIKTEILRNIYLIAAFLMTLISLYKAIPDNYISLSWILAAIAYFVFSILINNIKYRWVAIGIFIATAFYVFLVDLARIELVYRVITFLLLAVISIVISIIYTKRKKMTTFTEKNK